MLNLNNLSKEKYETLLRYSKYAGCEYVACINCVFYNRARCDLTVYRRIDGSSVAKTSKTIATELLTEYIKRIIESE